MHRIRKQYGSYTAHACPRAEALRGSWEDMFLTQPPVSSIHDVPDEEKAPQRAVRVGDVYEVCKSRQTNHGHSLFRHLENSEQWIHLDLSVDVDIVTGSMVLQIFKMSYEDFVRGGFLWRDGQDAAAERKAA